MILLLDDQNGSDAVAIAYDDDQNKVIHRVFNGMVSWLTSGKLYDHNRDNVIAAKFLTRSGFTRVASFCSVLAGAMVIKSASWSSTTVLENSERQNMVFGGFIKGFLDLLTVKFLTGVDNGRSIYSATIGLISFSLGLLAIGLSFRTLFM